MGLKKKFMNNIYYTVYDQDNIPASVDLSQNVAIVDKDGVVLPVLRNPNDKGPGYHRSGMCLRPQKKSNPLTTLVIIISTLEIVRT